jgi:Phage integrase family
VPEPVAPQSPADAIITAYSEYLVRERGLVEGSVVLRARAARLFLSELCPALRSKRVTMHTLRHTAAMNLLTAGVDASTIALWLGHEQERTTHIYLHADLELKQRTLDRITPPEGPPRPLPSTPHSARLPRGPIADPRYRSAPESERATGLTTNRGALQLDIGMTTRSA